MLDVFLGVCPEQHSHCLVGALCVKQRQEPWADSMGPAASAAVMLQWGLCHPVVTVFNLAKPAQTCWSMQPWHSSPAVWISYACHIPRRKQRLLCLAVCTLRDRSRGTSTVHIHIQSCTCYDSCCHQLAAQG